MMAHGFRDVHPAKSRSLRAQKKWPRSALARGPLGAKGMDAMDIVERLRAISSAMGSFGSIEREAADAIERLRREREELALAICGGEDAPGYANAQTVETLVKIVEDSRRIDRARAEAAEAKLATALAFVVAFDGLVSAIEEAGEDGGCWDNDPLWGPVIRARAALDDTGGGDAPSDGGEG